MSDKRKRSYMSFNSKDFKGFTFRSGPVKKTNSFSTFWDNQVDDTDVDSFLGLDTNVNKGKDLVALAGYKRAISNFVNISLSYHTIIYGPLKSYPNNKL